MMRLKFDNQITRLSRRLRSALLLTTSLLVSASVTAPPPRGEAFKAPVATLSGEVVKMPGRLCRPAQPGENAEKELQLCGNGVVRWFTQRGYAVASFLRPGYGEAPGRVEDVPGMAGNSEKASLLRAADIDAAVNAATALPGIRPDGVIVVGASTGGLGTVAYDALPHPHVAALISFAGGQGGHCNNVPAAVCHPAALLSAVRHFGARSTTPMLWVYAANDSWFTPPLAVLLTVAFQRTGGSAELHIVPPFAEEWHSLISDPLAPAVWGPLVADYLARMGATP